MNQPSTSSATPRLSIAGLSKTFPGQTALSGVSLEVGAGEIHGLVGQNGSGKSTLIKILSGYHDADPGARILLDGQPISERRGSIAFMHQDLALVSSMNAIENLAMGQKCATTRTGVIDWRTEHANAERVLSRLGADMDLSAPVGSLSGVDRSLLAMTRAIERLEEGGGLLVLDEPTASLPQREVALLFAAVREVAAAGTGILFVSHHLEEVFDLCDSVTVLRDGAVVESTSTNDLSVDELIYLIVGDQIEPLESAAGSVSDKAKVVLEVRGLTGITANDVSFDVPAGAVIGIAGLEGSGREEICSLVFGGQYRNAGAVSVNGETMLAGRPDRSMVNGMALVPADRLAEAIFPDYSVGYNITLPRLRSVCTRGYLDRRRELRDIEEWLDSMDIRPPQAGKPIGLLSGGNQQKAVLARCMRTEPVVLILDNPTQGVDVGAKSAMYELVARAADSGLAVLVASSDDRELARICSRVLVMRQGRVGSELDGADITPVRITSEVLREGASA